MSGSAVVLHDGPAKGRYSVRRGPIYLRAVIHEVTGKRDLLDMLDDRPTPLEHVLVYVADISQPRFMLRDDIFVCGRGPDGGMQQVGGASGVYHYLGSVEGDQLRTTAAWRDWVLSQPEDGVPAAPADCPECSVPCPTCHGGLAAWRTSHGERVPCPACHDTGTVSR